MKFISGIPEFRRVAFTHLFGAHYATSCLSAQLSARLRWYSVGTDQQLGGDLTSDETLWAYNGELASRQLTLRHDLSTTVHGVFIEPGASFEVQGFNFGFGIQCGYITGTSFTQKESIASPSTITYRDGSRERTVQSGFMPDVRNIQFGVNAGISYDFALPNMPEWTIAPEVQFTYAITNILYNRDWKTNVLRMGLAVKYTLDLPPTYHDQFGR